MAAVPPETGFKPLMTLYLTDDTSPEDVQEAKAGGIVAYKLYPAGATTNSHSGVTDLDKCLPALQAMQEARCSQDYRGSLGSFLKAARYSCRGRESVNLIAIMSLSIISIKLSRGRNNTHSSQETFQGMKSWTTSSILLRDMS